MAHRLPGERGTVLVATDGIRFEVILEGEDELPAFEWATLYWYLDDDPRQRPDWNRVRGYNYTPPNKLSKSDQ